MHDINCFDGSGNILRHFNQWELNNKIYIQDNEWKVAPVFQFENCKMERSITVQSIMGSDYSLEVDVPNELLLVPYPISVYMYITDKNDSAKSVAYLQIPVHAMEKPVDFVYKENIEYFSIDELRNNIKELENIIDALTFEAKNVPYDNSISKLIAAKVQSAIDEIVESMVFVGDIADGSYSGSNIYTTDTDVVYVLNSDTSSTDAIYVRLDEY